MSISILDQYIGAEELGLDTQAVAEEVAEVAAEAVRAEVAELAVEVEESSAQVEELVDAVNDLEEAAEEIAENVEGMESLLASGNYNSVAMANLYKRTNALAIKLGGGHEGSVLGAESISDASMAEMMAREGIESFMETAKRWGKKAIEFIKHIFNTVVNFFHGLINQAAALQRRAEQLKKRIKDGSSIKKEVKAGGWAVWLGKTEKHVAGADFIGKFMNEVGTDVNAITEEGYKSALNDLISSLRTGVKKDSDKTLKDDEVLIALEGGVRITVVAPEYKGDAKGAELAAHTRKIKLSFSIDPELKKKIVGETLKGNADAGSLTRHCDAVIKVASYLKEAKAQAKFNNAIRDKLIGSINAVYAKPGEDGEAQRKTAKAQVQMVQAAYATAAQLTTTVNKLVTRQASAKLDRVAAYLAFGKDAEDKKDD